MVVIQETLDYICTAETTGRIDKVLSSLYPKFTRSYLQKLVKEEFVTVNNKIVKSSFQLNEGDHILIEIPEPESLEILPENIPLDILYEDSDILIVNKPKGMVVHPAPGHYSGTLVNALLFHCAGELSGINGVLRPGIVHRIDKDTTGSLLICKTDFAHQKLALQFKEHSIHRSYRAIVYHNIKEEEGTINAPIGRDPNNRKKMCVEVKNGREAITHYKVLKRFGDFTYIECQLDTGRTHQIRVHMASIHHALLGDDIYGPTQCPYRLQGQTLHAMTLGIVHPRTNKYMEVHAPLPEYFEKLLTMMEK